MEKVVGLGVTNQYAWIQLYFGHFYNTSVRNNIEMRRKDIQ